MKKVILFILFNLFCASSEIYAKGDDTITISLEEKEHQPKERPDKGKRIPSFNKETCQIDFRSFTITTSITEPISHYVLWDDTGLCNIAVYTCDYDLVAYLSSISGSVQLHIATEERYYIGYIEL